MTKKPEEIEYNAAHIKALSAYNKKIDSLYEDVIKKLSKLSITADWKTDKTVQKSINSLVYSLGENIITQIGYGIDAEWDRANDLHNIYGDWAIGTSADKLPSEIIEKWYSRNLVALQAYKELKKDGMALSNRVWQYTSSFRKEVELILEMGIYEGQSAAAIASDLQQYLKNPDGLYRRVRKIQGDPNSPLGLSKAAQQYNPGRGVYRSSYKNALRLAVNEINDSYEYAKQMRRQQQDFVVGINISVSDNHDPAKDRGGIQCILLQGNYPVTFDWRYKWHVRCLCRSLAILKTREELDADLQTIINGGVPTRQSVNLVAKNPSNFTNYIQENKDLWKNWQNKPKFLENS